MFENIYSLATHYAIPFLITISIVVFVHEFGHYWVARRCGVKVETFSIGFGKELFGWTDKNGTRWKISLLPLGGYVKMYGDSSEASTPDASVREMTEDQKKVAFYHQSVNKRMAIVFAGPAINYIFAVIVLMALFIFQGQPYTLPVVGDVQENSAAAQGGVLKGDKILSIDGAKIERFEDIKRIVALNFGAPIALEIERDSARQTLTLTPEVKVVKDRFGGEHRAGRLGIASDTAHIYKKWPPHLAAWYALVETKNVTVDTMKALGQMIMGTRGAEELGGPLRIAEMSGKVAQDGVIALIWFMAMISINLGLINLFPVPLLDGGHLAFYLAEKLRGQPLHERVQETGAKIGLAMVLTLMVFATWNDLVHLKVVSYIKDML
ncbi:MAG: RIP metalloprotease RseP [Bdellovibrionales bacterium]